MTDKEMHPLTVSQCISSDWCRGYNEAVKEANDLIKRQQAEIEALINGQETLQKMCAEAYKRFADFFKQQMRDCACAEFDGIKYYLIGEEFVNTRLKELTEGSNEN